MQSLLAVSVLCCLLLGCCHGQCEVLNQSNLTKIRLCHQAYTIFEQALVSDKANLYTLRETFFSTEHCSPTLIFIRYRIQGNDLKNMSQEVVVWSSSSLFKFINPLLFMASIPTILLVAFFMVNIQTIPHHVITLSLTVDVNDTYLSLSPKEELDVLTTMTAKVSNVSSCACIGFMVCLSSCRSKLTLWLNPSCHNGMEAIMDTLFPLKPLE